LTLFFFLTPVLSGIFLFPIYEAVQLFRLRFIKLCHFLARSFFGMMPGRPFFPGFFCFPQSVSGLVLLIAFELTADLGSILFTSPVAPDDLPFFQHPYAFFLLSAGQRLYEWSVFLFVSFPTVSLLCRGDTSA